MSIKAIETVYRGYRFRSRLEARWAVYFDDLGVDWIYEDEGFEFSDGKRYLPDFYLRDYGMFVEVKGERPTSDERAMCEKLADQSGKACLLVFGLPGEHLQALYCWDVTDGSAGRYKASGVLKFLHDGTAEFTNELDHRLDADRDLRLSGDFGGVRVVGRYAPVASASTGDRLAIAAARAARFEFGESGAPR